MTEREAFIEAIAAQPDEDTPRLAFADWLQEHGEDDRAAFVRLACEIGARRKALGHPEGVPPELKGACDSAHDLFERNRGRWFDSFHRALACDETGLAERPRSWTGRVWERVAGVPRVSNHCCESFQGDAAEVRVSGNGPVREIHLGRGFVEELWIDFGSPFTIPDLATAFDLEPVHRLDFRFGANPALWKSLDAACLNRVTNLGLRLPGAYQRRSSAAFAELAFGGNWSGLRRLHFWSPEAGGFLVPRGFVRQLANAPLLAGIHGLFANIAFADLPLLTASSLARGLRELGVWNSRLPPDATEVIAAATFQPNLERLHLAANDLGDAGVRRLVAVRWPKLRALDLSANGVTDAGVRALLPLVPQLTHLSLYGETHTDAGAMELADALDADRLEWLSLSYNPLSPETVAALRERFGKRFLFLSHDDDPELEQFP